MSKRALIIANQHYEDPRFTELRGAAADARALAAVLGDRLTCDFDVQVLPEAGARQAKKEIQNFFMSGRPDDLQLLHLSCHGRRDETNNLYFVSQDTEFDYLESTGIDAAFIQEQVERSRCRRSVLLLDCCYSGTYVKGMRGSRGPHPSVDIESHLGGTGSVVLTACSALQYAFDADLTSTNPDQPSVFTAAVVEALRTGAGDIDGDGFVSTDDLFQYVRETVARKVPNQTPELSVNRIQGSLYLSRSPASLFFSGYRDPLTPMLHNAITRGEPWQRFGATLALERLLDDPDRLVRSAAREALVPLARDADAAVRHRALEVWTTKQLGTSPVFSGTEGGHAEVVIPGRAVGIDFGTTNSLVAIYENEQPSVVTNRFGATTTPSVVAFVPPDRVLVGEPAKRQALLSPDSTAQSVKRRLGTAWSVRAGRREYQAETVAALILERLRLDAEDHLDVPVTHAVITVPTRFDVIQREGLRRAAAMAGLTAMRFVNEPTAAALAFGLGRENEEIVLVIDLGGGTLDVSLLELGDGVAEVKATAGDESLGGIDWDEALTHHLAARCAAEFGLDTSSDQVAQQRLREAAEEAKVLLSESTEACISLPYLGQVDGRPVHFSPTVTRRELESATRHLVDRCRWPIEDVIRAAGMSAHDVDHIVLVGGASRMPAVADLVQRLTGRQPTTGVHPEEAIAAGAALMAATMTGAFGELLLLDVVHASLSLESRGGVSTRMIGRYEVFPIKRSEVFTTAVDDQRSVVIQVFEGEAALTEANRRLAVLELDGLSPAPHNVPRIEVTFSVDPNGVLTVSAEDLHSGHRKSVTISEESVRAAALFRSDPGTVATRTEPEADRHRSTGPEPDQLPALGTWPAGTR